MQMNISKRFICSQRTKGNRGASLKRVHRYATSSCNWLAPTFARAHEGGSHGGRTFTFGARTFSARAFIPFRQLAAVNRAGPIDRARMGGRRFVSVTDAAVKLRLAVEPRVILEASHLHCRAAVHVSRNTNKERSTVGGRCTCAASARNYRACSRSRPRSRPTGSPRDGMR